ncbi:F-box-like domain-containing protein [Sodalis glossinidius]|uniref:F-box-like domain-containing protein n=1 Tax=Sodalis glossinidius TaxID=63612 RepID=UPI0005A4BB69|nr:F-box-like domain-containing protein [Sodalis glossinidius]
MPIRVDNTPVDLNTAAPNKKNINDLPPEMLEHIFNYIGNDKFNVRLTCHAFNDVVERTLNEYELFKIAYSELLLKSSFDSRLINDLIKQSEEEKRFVLKNCQVLHKAGFDMSHILTLDKKDDKTQPSLFY